MGKRKTRNRPVQNDKVEPRPDLADPANGKDLSFLNEFPQFSTDEGVKGGVPPPENPGNNADSER